MKEYKQVALRRSVFKVGDNPIFGESATYVTIEDEAGGPFIVLNQSMDGGKDQEVRFDGAEEINFVAKVAKELMSEYEKVVKL